MGEGKILSFDEIVAASDREERTVPVPAWGGSVRVRGISRKEHRQLMEWSTDKKGEIDSDRLEMWLFIKGLIEPTVTKAQYQQLLEKNTGSVQLVLDAIMEVSGLRKGAIEEAEADFREEAG